MLRLINVSVSKGKGIISRECARIVINFIVVGCKYWNTVNK